MLQEEELGDHMRVVHGETAGEGGEGGAGGGFGCGRDGDGERDELPESDDDAATDPSGETQPPHDGSSGIDGDHDMHDAEDVEVNIPTAVTDMAATATQQRNSTLGKPIDNSFQRTRRDSGPQDSLSRGSLATTPGEAPADFVDLTTPAFATASLDAQHQNAIATNSRFSTTARAEAERPNKCWTCGKSYKRRWELTRHKKLHAGQKWPCPMPTCDRHQKPFDTYEYCMKHVRYKHSESIKKMYRCMQPKCFFASLWEEDVASHTKQAHSGEHGMLLTAQTVGGSSGSGGADVGTATSQMTIGEDGTGAIARAIIEAAQSHGGKETEA